MAESKYVPSSEIGNEKDQKIFKKRYQTPLKKKSKIND